MLSSHALVEAAAVAAPVRDLASVLLGVLVSAALLARVPSLRWGASITALIVAALLLAGVALDDPSGRLTDAGAALAVAAVVGLIGLAAVTAALVRWPRVLPVALVVVLPLRIPIAVGGDPVNLLVPLYGLIGAGTLAYAYLAWQRGRERAAAWDLRSGPSELEAVRHAWHRSSLQGIASAVPILLAASVLVYALRIPFSLDPDRGTQTLCFFLAPFSVLFVLLREADLDRRQLRLMALAILALALVAVALGSYEWFTGKVLWGQAVLDPASLSPTPRVNSLFFDPNIYGRFLMVVLLGVLTALVWRDATLPAAALLALLVVLWLGMLISFSQSSMLGLIVGGLVLLGLRYGWGKSAGLSALLLIAGVVAVVAFGSQIRVNSSSTEELDVASAGRVELIRGGVDLAAEKPVFGWGSGAYRRAYREHTQTSGTTAVNASHTIPITVAAEQGIVGLLVYLGLIGAILTALLQGARERAARAAIAAAMAALIVHTWFYAAFLEDPVTWALLAVGLSLGAASPGATSDDAGQPVPGAGGEGGATPVAAAAPEA